ncbi:hypothetical protein HYS54_03345 [Candidatus Micrarchaeota archaeon]|nr:hypothetical protein [Candidatus Micrarchaeota archaeon]
MHLKISKKRYEHNCHHLEHLAKGMGATLACKDNGDHIELNVTGPEENVEKVRQKLRIFGAR